MQIAPVSMTNQYRTNRSNTKCSTSPKFGYNLPSKPYPNRPTTIIELIQKIYGERSIKEYKEFKQALAEFEAKRLDITDIKDEYTPIFQQLGKKATEEFNKIMNSFNAPIKEDGTKDLSKIDVNISPICSRQYFGATYYPQVKLDCGYIPPLDRKYNLYTDQSEYAHAETFLYDCFLESAETLRRRASYLDGTIKYELTKDLDYMVQYYTKKFIQNDKELESLL